MKTSRTMLILGLLLLCARGAAGQEPSFGFKVGATRATISWDNAEVIESKTGVLMGAFADIPLGSSFAVAPELCYVKKGGRFAAGGMNIYLNLDYLEIPVLLKHTWRDGTAHPFLAFGPSLGIRTSASISAYGENMDVGEDFTTTDFGLVFGGGVNFQRFLVEARYNLGLTNINDDPGLPDASIKSGVWNFLVGYSF